MLAILKRELKGYFNSPIAYVLIGIFTAISALFFTLMSIMYGSADMSSVLTNMGFVLLFIVPILTMRSLAEEKKNKTEVLLITSPVKITSIVVGKFLGAFIVFLVMTAITFIFPLVLSLFGHPDAAPIIGGYIGFILLGASFIAIGVFASSLTENQIVAAIVTFVILLFIWLMEPLASSLGGFAAKVLNYVALLTRYGEFNQGILNLSSIVYYISFTAVFLFFTTRVIERRRWGQE